MIVKHTKPEKLEPQIHKKGWGQEVWVVNDLEYCLKLLQFNKGADFSMHYHMIKDETWYVQSGKLKLEFFDLTTAERQEAILQPGDIYRIRKCIPHKLTALEDSEIIEVSSTHFDTDSYRIEPGQSQR